MFPQKISFQDPAAALTDSSLSFAILKPDGFQADLLVCQPCNQRYWTTIPIFSSLHPCSEVRSCTAVEPGLWVGVPAARHCATGLNLLGLVPTQDKTWSSNHGNLRYKHCRPLPGFGAICLEPQNLTFGALLSHSQFSKKLSFKSAGSGVSWMEFLCLLWSQLQHLYV